MDLERIEKAVREILLAVGEDPEREGLQETPNRVARMYAEIFSGLKSDPKQHLKIFHEEGEHDELVFVRDIPLYSVCEHHLLPFSASVILRISRATARSSGFPNLPALSIALRGVRRCRSV